jgi:hypothetical protein
MIDGMAIDKESLIVGNAQLLHVPDIGREVGTAFHFGMNGFDLI